MLIVGICAAHHVHYDHILTLPSCMRHLELSATPCMYNTTIIAPHPIISATSHENNNDIHPSCIRATHHAHPHNAPLASLYLHPNCCITLNHNATYPPFLCHSMVLTAPHASYHLYHACLFMLLVPSPNNTHAPAIWYHGICSASCTPSSPTHTTIMHAPP